MAGSVNKVIIVGTLGDDPDVRDLAGGQKVANLRVATSEQWTDRNSGEKRVRTEWHNISVFDQNSAQYAQNYLQKGDCVYIEGRLETRKWLSQSGEDRYSTEVIVKPIGGRLVGLSGVSEATKVEDHDRGGPAQPPFIDDVIPF